MNKWYEGWIKVNETQNFAIMHNPEWSPFDENKYSYYLVYKQFGSVEGYSNSIVLVSQFLQQAEEQFNTGTREEEEVPQQAIKLN